MNNIGELLTKIDKLCLETTTSAATMGNKVIQNAGSLSMIKHLDEDESTDKLSTSEIRLLKDDESTSSSSSSSMSSSLSSSPSKSTSSSLVAAPVLATAQQVLPRGPDLLNYDHSVVFDFGAYHETTSSTTQQVTRSKSNLNKTMDLNF